MLAWRPWPHTASASVGSRPHTGCPESPVLLSSLSMRVRSGLHYASWLRDSGGHAPIRPCFSSPTPDLHVALNSALWSHAGFWLLGVGEKTPWILGGMAQVRGGPSSSGAQCGCRHPEFSLGISSHYTSILFEPPGEWLLHTFFQFILVVNLCVRYY